MNLFEMVLVELFCREVLVGSAAHYLTSDLAVFIDFLLSVVISEVYLVLILVKNQPKY